MVLQPVDAMQNHIASGQGSLQRQRLLAQRAPLLVDASLKHALSRGQFEQFTVHSDACFPA